MYLSSFSGFLASWGQELEGGVQVGLCAWLPITPPHTHTLPIPRHTQQLVSKLRTQLLIFL